MILTVKAHAKYKNCYQDPNDQDVWYITNLETTTGYNSQFLIPELCRYFILPDDSIGKLIQHGAEFDSEMLFIKYRSIWKNCPACGGEFTCASIYAEDSNVFVGHCLKHEDFNLGVIEEEGYLQNNIVFYKGEQRINNENEL